MLRRCQVADLAKMSQIAAFWAGRGLNKACKMGFGGLSSAMKLPKGEGGWQLGCESGPRKRRSAQDLTRR